MRAAAVIAAIALACMSLAAADPLEGRWQINGDGALLDIRQSAEHAASLEIAWCDGPDLTVAPGAVIGTATPSGTPGVYDCKIALDPRPDNPSARRAGDFRLTLKGADTFTLEPYRRKRSLSLWRWLPYLFRVTVINEDNRPADLDGATRVGRDPQFIVI
ncbi:MAG: hypothetical protein Q4C34_03920 [Bacteroidales bacterium]|nr:hypothetical protein [Bacteroidales bacterium]